MSDGFREFVQLHTLLMAAWLVVVVTAAMIRGEQVSWGWFAALILSLAMIAWKLQQLGAA